MTNELWTITKISDNGLDSPRYEVNDGNNFTVCIVDHPNDAQLIASAPRLREALETIAKIALWGETENINIDEAKDSHEWDEEQSCYNPCIDTESSNLDYIVELARSIIKKTNTET